MDKSGLYIITYVGHGQYFIWGFLVFSFLVFSVYKNLKFNQHLRFLAIFPDREMLQFWSVYYICQVCKLYFHFAQVRNFRQYLYFSVFSKQLTCPTFSFCYIYVVYIVIKAVFFCTFWRLKTFALWRKIIKNLLIFVHLFCPKNSTTDSRKTSMTQEWLVVRRKLCDSSLNCIFNALSICVQYALSFK